MIYAGKAVLMDEETWLGFRKRPISNCVNVIVSPNYVDNPAKLIDTFSNVDDTSEVYCVLTPEEGMKFINNLNEESVNLIEMKENENSTGNN